MSTVQSTTAPPTGTCSIDINLRVSSWERQAGYRMALALGHGRHGDIGSRRIGAALQPSPHPCLGVIHPY